jgi:Fur family zinc uptake transcriptional regulator
MICRQCETVAETQSPMSNLNLSATADVSGFRIEQTIIEAKGVCNSCAEIEQL